MTLREQANVNAVRHRQGDQAGTENQPIKALPRWFPHSEAENHGSDRDLEERVCESGQAINGSRAEHLMERVHHRRLGKDDDSRADH